jgi:hypothetical protein
VAFRELIHLIHGYDVDYGVQPLPSLHMADPALCDYVHMASLCPFVSSSFAVILLIAFFQMLLRVL